MNRARKVQKYNDALRDTGIWSGWSGRQWCGGTYAPYVAIVHLLDGVPTP